MRKQHVSSRNSRKPLNYLNVRVSFVYHRWLSMDWLYDLYRKWNLGAFGCIFSEFFWMSTPLDKRHTTDDVRKHCCLIQLRHDLRWYHTLQGDNSLKSVERFDHMMFVCRFQASRWSKPERKATMWLENL